MLSRQRDAEPQRASERVTVHTDEHDRGGPEFRGTTRFVWSAVS
jgi:hypothetical protein